MQSKNKTIETNASIIDFLNSIDIDEQKRKDSIDLIDLMKKWSGHEPKMWGPSIIGFGSYHYKYDIYFKKLSDLDLKILEKLCKVALDHK